MATHCSILAWEMLYQYRFSKFHIYVLMYDICFSLSDLLHCVWYPWFLKLKIEPLYDWAIPLLGIYPEKTIIQKDTCTLTFTAALFTRARTWKQLRYPQSFLTGWCSPTGEPSALLRPLIQYYSHSDVPSQAHPNLMFSQISGHLMAQSNWHIKLTIPWSLP